MALNLFKRVDSVKGLFAVESISLIYNALTTIMVLILWPRMDHPGTMLLERAGIVVITFALIYLYHKYPCKLSAFIRMAVQMAFLAYWYPDTFEFNRLFPIWIISLLLQNNSCSVASHRWSSANFARPCGSASPLI